MCALQYWGQHVYHLYEEDFIRLGPILDYATAHPHVKLHVKIPDDQPGPHAWLTGEWDIAIRPFLQLKTELIAQLPRHLTELFCSWAPSFPLPTELTQAFGLDPSRLVWGSVRGRIVHVPEGTPCGEPYAFNQVRTMSSLRFGLAIAVLVQSVRANWRHVSDDPVLVSLIERSGI